ncbi:DUF2264 domain-containing protein [Nonomuraea sp. NPDC049269]|uniref:DUF2264 domain-containing protein n=1 Tax=Nonomuraea sp. NPDC049269 TaxID=3364349 RepID=UPI0037127BC3
MDTDHRAGRPGSDRDDLRHQVLDLVAPLISRFSPGKGRLRLGVSTAHYDRESAELEAFARPLWGLAPLAAGGGTFDHWDLWRDGLAAGTDPEHPDYWGAAFDRNQRLVETAALGLTLALAPEQIWDPLTGRQRDTVAAWLRHSVTVEPNDNNWLFFPVMVGLGLDRVGVSHDHDANRARLDRLEEFDLGRGWYSDGPKWQRDYYIPFAMHYYGLIYAALGDDPARAERFRERAAAFAQDFQHWFTGEGVAVPFGRSLTYRFAQSAFWGALAFAGVEALPWEVTKGHLLRNLRWWSHRPIRDSSGLLTIGYGYPQPHMAEQYNAPGSPYWAMKAFLPLALPAEHPFWAAKEADAPPLPEVSTQPEAGVALLRCEEGRHVVMLSAGQHAPWARHGAAKYAKFAYSTRFGFSVPAGTLKLEQGAFDSTLALSEDGEHWRPCELPYDVSASDGVLHAHWTPWDDVEIETWLVALPPWHVRVHRIRTGRALRTAEGAFAIDRDSPPTRVDTGPGRVRLDSPHGLCVIEDVSGGREGALVAALSGTNVRREGVLVTPLPGTNVFAPRTTIPTLTGDLPPGEHLLACVVIGLEGRDAGSASASAGPDAAGDDGWPEPPTWDSIEPMLNPAPTP